MTSSGTGRYQPRGPLSEKLLTRLHNPEPISFSEGVELLEKAEHAVADSADFLHNGDLQLTLFALYALCYGSEPEWEAHSEWDPHLTALRQSLERHFEAALRQQFEVPQLPAAEQEAVAAALFELTSADNRPSLSRYFAKRATEVQARELLVLRSIYTLREADPHSWAIPRLTGRAKTALVEIQNDEYGNGDAEKMHAELFARAMRAAGLSDQYGAYLDLVPVITLTNWNMMSMFGVNRRLLGAIVGHLAAFEMTSSLPNRGYAEGLRRLGFGPDVTQYFDEHVEADAVHEQIAARDLAGALAQEQPELLRDIFFGVTCCLAVDGLAAAETLAAWQQNVSALVTVMPPAPAGKADQVAVNV